MRSIVSHRRLRRRNKVLQTKGWDDHGENDGVEINRGNTAVGRYVHNFSNRRRRRTGIDQQPAQAAFRLTRRRNLKMNNVSAFHSLGMGLAWLRLPHRLKHKGELLHMASKGFLFPPPPAALVGKDIVVSNMTPAGCESFVFQTIYSR